LIGGEPEADPAPPPSATPPLQAADVKTPPAPVVAPVAIPKPTLAIKPKVAPHQKAVAPPALP